MARRNLLPPLNPARAFEATGRLLSVSKAAEELSVTPAAVSRQVRTLEAYLGTTLLERAPGGRMQLTPAGARYLSELMPLFVSLREATLAVTGSRYGGNTLRIRSPATFAVRWLIPRLASFHQRHKDIDVQLTTSFQPLDFQREDIDAGIQLGTGRWPGLSTLQLIPNVLVPVAAPSLQIRSKRDLGKHSLLHSLARPDDWVLWLEAAGLRNIDPSRGMKYETSLLAYQAAAEGHGVAMAQKELVAKDLSEGTLVTPFDLELDRGDHTYYFAWATDRPESGALKAFRQWLSSTVKD
ncbi:LysR substrate-binding domain-containing protein [Cupriavidus oxalaticus]|uniref:LysR family transcriptional regulator n=1 Tax=Cupriavidus oxalaticus TaxID=96344 RepID=A0A375GDQ0_9BURK|nr:LysR substrate-binding domain-containing protein [Cupriavidus oxalaticus]QRQ84282.1 LysR family transcriptional regulator [Cupriavidus oxalaticus]QRQ91632.1 LysR family transcriptional regulator [Cupriavidus oxalaticus]WQD86209.1 LysR substrate-binding domain-containing protein [Cupriavidus oxalaticus]SPC05124.1 LysR family transcriptional regulator [Cupriavidus oxalaticus]SPC18142.1 LysR family transcriptional regulator [Cupriavidus oxalaticus]